MSGDWGRSPHHNRFAEYIHRQILDRMPDTHSEWPAMTDDQQRALEQMHRHLDEYPDDWDTRLVLADLLSETGDNWAEACQRWMVRERKCPRRMASHLWGWLKDTAMDDQGHPESVLPRGLFNRVADAQLYVQPHSWTRQYAEQRLAWALRQTGALDEVR